MGDIINISSIHDYNEFLGIETLNPLVTFIDFREVKVLKHKKKLYGFYGIYLKEKIHGKLTYGRSQYDYQEGTLVFVAPGQVAGIDDGGETPNPEGYCLLFHPDLLRGTSLARKMKEYTFFSYEVNEALHMSERERRPSSTVSPRYKRNCTTASTNTAGASSRPTSKSCSTIASAFTTASLPPAKPSTAMSSPVSRN